jgi:diadenosine tetraphosphate (Ap4A) HIT family hydrolase
MTPCVLCQIAPERVILETRVARAVLDAYPISEGHTLVVPRLHIGSIYELSSEDQRATWEHVARVRDLLVERYGVESFNIGLNDGTAAGQTISHAHIHVIPRRTGDTPDPRGGVRWVIADKAAYWK